VTSIYTLRLGIGQAAAGANTLIYTAPENVSVVIRDIVFDNTSATGSQAILYVSHGSSTSTLFRGVLAGNQSLHLELRQAIEAGDTVSLLNQGSAGLALVVLTGYVFR
jgi:hypothetical protein